MVLAQKPGNSWRLNIWPSSLPFFLSFRFFHAQDLSYSCSLRASFLLAEWRVAALRFLYINTHRVVFDPRSLFGRGIV